MKKFPTKQLCRAGIIAALYVALTIPLGSFAFGSIGFQIRPAEALTILPLFYAEGIVPQKLDSRAFLKAVAARMQ